VTNSLTAECAAKLEQFFAADARGTAAVHLFGSIARGSSREDSDVDVAVLLEQDPPRTLAGLPVELAAASHIVSDPGLGQPRSTRELFARLAQDSWVSDVLANGGGVSVSCFEWVPDRHGCFRTEREVPECLEAKMREAFDAALQTAPQYRANMRPAACMVGINRVATGTRMRGVYA
jgi:predicted nucleotidyltransferase